ncbi:MAG: penicillin-binding protein activator LpoB [Xanthomonadaceae bacterium]|nr:penicillin-binding protein activator LpoB [Xanthomonadaceae bacterium]
MKNHLMLLVGVLAVVGLISLSSCGPKEFTKGEYDDPTRVELLDDKFNEADMQTMSETIVKAMIDCPAIKEAKKKPTVIMDRVQNRTEEHIDTKSMTDKIRTALIKSGKVRFVNREERETLEGEYAHNESGAVSRETMKKRGKQIGSDYIFNGAMATNIQQMGNDKFIYYKLTMNLTNTEESTIDCTEEREVRKKYRKQSVGL